MGRIKLRSVRNIRDFSDIVNRSGYKIKNGLFFRSSVLHDLAPKDVKILYDEYKLKTVIDLRTKMEISEKPDIVPDNVDYISIPIFDDSVFGITHEEETRQKFHIPNMEELYRGIVTDDFSVNALRQVFQAIFRAYEKGPVLWHCTVGKDRCGIVSALFLYLLDADIETIFEDYLMTNRAVNLEAMKYYCLILLHSRNREVAQKVRKAFIADRNYLQAALDAISEKYGSIDSFLAKELYITEDMKKRLREYSLVPE
ncbi:MAG TPA: tyrosine-protein phosphatase [Clostridiaceae bacterium]|mgnify:CR=1 FL=1|nr:tyrosine-protein phosphatase [Clostridiaceae bacterium]